jgi:hypothetical protein
MEHLIDIFVDSGDVFEAGFTLGGVCAYELGCDVAEKRRCCSRAIAQMSAGIVVPAFEHATAPLTEIFDPFISEVTSAIALEGQE